MWTTFRPRSSSNASTVSTRLSPLRPESEVLAGEEMPASVSSYAGGVPPTLKEDLELLDGLNITSSHSLLSRSSLSGFSLQHPGVTGPLHTYSTSLFSPAEGPLSAGEGCFSSSQSLEALLTSDTPPPPANVLMTQVDPILSQAPTLLLLGGIPSSSKVATGVGLCPKPPEAPGPSSLIPPLPMIAPPPVMVGAPIPKTLGTPMLTSSTEATSQARMPQDLDLDMYLENLECDMDNIISDLMDGEEGLDFNFEPGTAHNLCLLLGAELLPQSEQGGGRLRTGDRWSSWEIGGRISIRVTEFVDGTSRPLSSAHPYHVAQEWWEMGCLCLPWCGP